MIELIKKSKSSFFINVDMLDVEKFIYFIKRIENNEEFYISYLSQKKRLEIQIDDEKDELLITNDYIRVYMDVEELEYFIERLEKALISKSFFPAEICERHYKKMCVTIYCNIN